MELINLTPHEVNIVSEWGTRNIPPSGQLARVSVETVVVGETDDGILITASSYGEVEGLPEPEEGVGYIVSSLVAGHCKDRNDVFIPNDSIRDDKGRIVGCRTLGIVR